MTLDEAIKHCEEKSDCSECSKEHQQLAEWLKELKKLRSGGIELWAAMDEDDESRIYVFDFEPKCNEGVWGRTWDYIFLLDPKDFPGINFENSPRKLRLLMED